MRRETLIWMIAAVTTATGTNSAGQQPVEHGSMHPSWSPDGRRIVFESDRDGDFEIFVMDADGSGVRQLTHNAVGDRMPLWSPDGRTIRYMSGEHSGDHRWMQISVSGGTPRVYEPPAANLDSVRSADGTLAVYAVPDPAGTPGLHGGPQILFAKLGKGEPRRISPAGHAEEPVLSPDGKWLVFEHRKPRDELIASMLYIVDPRGPDPARPLTGGTNPSWSPDGRLIVFKSWDPKRRQLVISTIRPDGSGLSLLTPGVLPSWSKDGKRILYMAEQGGWVEIFTMLPTGADQRCLTCK